MSSSQELKTRNQARLLVTTPRFVECVVEERLNRFVVAVRHGRELKRAHINNTGRLLELLSRGRGVACIPWSEKASPRRTSLRLFAVREESGWALIDTQFQMRAFEQAVEDERIWWLKRYSLARRNPRPGDSVLDYLLREHQGPGELFLETKSAVLREGTFAMYPDCPTERGQRHVRELMEHVAQGGKGAICFVAAMPRVSAFRPSVAGDPVVAALIKESQEAGVDVRAVAMHFDGNGILLDNPDLPVLFP